MAMPKRKIRRPPKERVLIESLAHGNLLAAAPGFQDYAEWTREQLAGGLTEEQVRQRLRSRLETDGLTLKRQLFPGLSRKVQRVRLRRLLLALADHIASRAPANRLGGALDLFFDKIGFDQWLEDAIWTYASTGEAVPMLASYGGTVYRASVGPEGEKSPLVFLIATPASDVSALMEWFEEEAQAAFPDATFAKRSGKAAEGARYYLMNQEGQTFEQIAHDNITALYPDLLASDDDAEFEHYTWLATKETERIKKLALRTARRGDIIFDYKSPEG
jgi:hypothetical protein